MCIRDSPLPARIVSIVDSYHAMISDRPYRDAMTKEQAIQTLKDGAGIQWDPFLVDIFVAVLASLNDPRSAPLSAPTPMLAAPTSAATSSAVPPTAPPTAPEPVMNARQRLLMHSQGAQQQAAPQIPIQPQPIQEQPPPATPAQVTALDPQRYDDIPEDEFDEPEQYLPDLSLIHI